MAQPNDHTTVEVTNLPTCDLCAVDDVVTLAHADAHVPFLNTWANVCEHHFNLHGCKLGLGMGQQLIVTVTHA